MIDQALAKIDTFEFLDEYGVKQLHDNGQWVNGLCPFHHDHNPSFGMNKISKVWKCFAGCGSGDIISFIEKAEGLGRIEATKKIFEIAAGIYVEEGREIDYERIQHKLYAIMRTVDSDVWMKTYDPSIIERWRYIHPYMIQRGIEDKYIYRFFKCGYSPEHQRLTFPIFYFDKLVGVQGRRVDNQKPKYMPIPGYEFPSSKVVYNYCPEYDRVCLVEGVIDCIYLWTLGNLNTMSILGSSLGEEQAKLIIDNFKTVILWLDNDHAGKEGIIKAIDRLGGNVEILVAGYPEGRNDPAECSRKDIELVKANLISSGEYILRLKMRQGKT